MFAERLVPSRVPKQTDSFSTPNVRVGSAAAKAREIAKRKKKLEVS
jgi:hypothetical protein